MQRVLAALVFLGCSSSACATEESAPVPSSGQAAPIKLHAGAASASRETIATLTEKDRQLFDAVFGCKPGVLATLVTDDFEFFHDKWGQTDNSAKEFVDSVSQGCERQKTGSDFKARRELIDGSMTVHMLDNYGALQIGMHRFFALQAGQQDRLTETGKFIHLWKNDNGTWKLARVISYDHQLAQAAK